MFFVNNIIGDKMMDRYNQIVDKHTPKEDRLKNALVTFVAGGIFGVLAELLLRCYCIWFDLPRKESGVIVTLTLVIFLIRYLEAVLVSEVDSQTLVVRNHNLVPDAVQTH